MATVSGTTEHLEAEIKQHPPQEVEVITSPAETETVLVDGVKGVSVLNGIVRINFIESYADTLLGGLRGRHVVTLAMAQQNLAPILELLNQIAGDMAKQTALQAEPVETPAPNESA